MFDILGRAVGSFFHGLFQVVWGAIWFIPFIFAGGIVFYGYVADDVIVLLIGAALSLAAITVCGGVALFLKG